MKNITADTHLPDGTYYTSGKFYSGLSRLANYTSDSKLGDIMRRSRLKNVQIKHSKRLIKAGIAQ